MKKIYTLLFIALALFASCSKDDSNENDGNETDLSGTWYLYNCPDPDYYIDDEPVFDHYVTYDIKNPVRGLRKYQFTKAQPYMYYGKVYNYYDAEEEISSLKNIGVEFEGNWGIGAWNVKIEFDKWQWITPSKGTVAYQSRIVSMTKNEIVLEDTVYISEDMRMENSQQFIYQSTYKRIK